MVIFMNNKKLEQLFLLSIMSIGAFSLLCLSGCGGCSAECVKCGTYNAEEIFVTGISIPGCGGCLTPKKGCDSCLWPQSVKCTYGATDEGHFSGCDTRYYGNGCLGCGQIEKNTYLGTQKSNESCIVFYGESESEETIIGCIDGSCIGCMGAGYEGFESIVGFEMITGIK